MPARSTIIELQITVFNNKPPVGNDLDVIHSFPTEHFLVVLGDHY